MKIKEYEYWMWALLYAAVAGAYIGMTVIVGLAHTLLHTVGLL